MSLSPDTEGMIRGMIAAGLAKDRIEAIDLGFRFIRSRSSLPLVREPMQDGEGVINDALALIEGYAESEEERDLFLRMAILGTAEKLARLAGRGVTSDLLKQTAEFIETADPARPWPA